jgi:hypothetical protein
MWFVSYFHPFHFTSLSPCTWYNPTLKYFFLTVSRAQSFRAFLETFILSWSSNSLFSCILKDHHCIHKIT